MLRYAMVLFCLAILSCNNKKKQADDDEKGFSYEKFSERFRTLSPPYQLSDTGLLNNRDTTGLRNVEFTKFLSDSLKNILFGKGSKPRYTALAHFKTSDENSLYLVKAQSGNKKAAILYAFDQGVFSAAFPFLIPDNDPSTSQVTVIDKSFAITKSITQKRQNMVTGEGKEVYDYDASIKSFSLILTNPLNQTAEVINPIDTFSRKHRFAGDYVKNKRNFVSIRDGRYPNQLLLFIHVDKNEGGCTGELKGDILMTSATTAIYRQGGDPCVMRFRFSSSSITVEEDEGCGSRRGIDCVFDGSYPKKKEPRSKQNTKKRNSK